MAADEIDDSKKAPPGLPQRLWDLRDDDVMRSMRAWEKDFLHGRLPLQRAPSPTKWKWQPEILFGEKNDLTKQDQLSTIMLASIIARLGGVVQFVDRELESCNLTLDFERINVDGVAMHKVSTRYPLPNPIDKLNAFADRWEQRAATLPSDAAGELIDMAAELRQVAGRLFE